MKIFLGADHRGFEAKNKIKDFLLNRDHEVIDCGPFELDKDDDYPDFIHKVAESVSQDENSFGIVLGYSGQGEAIVANRYRKVRSIVYNTQNAEIIKLGREHNDANVLSIGTGFVSEDAALKAAELFLTTPFTGEERHTRRIKKIEK